MGCNSCVYRCVANKTVDYYILFVLMSVCLSCGRNAGSAVVVVVVLTCLFTKLYIMIIDSTYVVVIMYVCMYKKATLVSRRHRYKSNII